MVVGEKEKYLQYIFIHTVHTYIQIGIYKNTYIHYKRNSSTLKHGFNYLYG